MKRWLLIFHTLRYLKLRQIAYQLYYRVREPRLRKLSEPVIRAHFARWEGEAFLKPATQDGEWFSFLGQTARFDGNWNNPEFPKLWLYNLHYQDDLNAVGAKNHEAYCAQMVDAWISGNPPIGGNGWEPYCISLRVVNWVKFFSRLSASKVRNEWLVSLAQQADVLEQRLEFHILANHLLANAKALVFVGSYLGGEQGDRWLRKGLKLLDHEIPEQFLEDGAHFERSPMYQGILLWDLADLILLADIIDTPQLEQNQRYWLKLFESGLSWLEFMCHPDGEISFFNDASFGIAPTLEDLRRYCLKLGVKVVKKPREVNSWLATHLKTSGYIVVDHAQHRAHLDIAEIGPNYQPGHAHADTLSFELSLFGHRLFVNSGTSRYGVGPEREYQRGTRAHSTVEVDDKNSSEIWAGFRVARRARPADISVNSDAKSIYISAFHDGYRRLPGKVLTKRSWVFEEGVIQVVDKLSGCWSKAVSRFYCHPSITVNQINESELLLYLPQGQTVRFSVEGSSKLHLVDSEWYPSFGCSTPNICIEAVFSCSQLVSKIDYQNQ